MDRRIRVLFAIGSLEGGGSERQLIGILRHLDRRRFAPLLYLVRREGALLSEVPPDVPVIAFQDDYRQPRLYIPGRIHRAQVCHMVEVIRRETIDVVYDRTYNMTIITGEATRKTHTPRVSVVVTDPATDFENNSSGFPRVRRRLLNRAYRTADRLLAVSEGVRRATVNHHALPDSQVVTIENFLDVERIEASLQGAARRPVDDGPFEIVGVGRLHPQKGFDILIEALALLNSKDLPEPVHLSIVGIGPAEAELRKLTAARELDACVSFEGFVENIPRRLRDAHLYCLSSRYEGMPNVVLEALYCGVPVLATDCPSGPREILCNGKYGRLVAPGNVIALAEAIADALTDYPCWQSIVAVAREHVCRRFGPKAGIARLEEVLEGVLNLPDVR